MVGVAEPLRYHHMFAMLSVLERNVHSCTSKQIATPSWWRTLPDISKSDLVVPPVGLDQLTKSSTISGGKWARQTMGWGAAGYGEGRAVLGCACISRGTAMGPGSSTPPHIVPDAPW